MRKGLLLILINGLAFYLASLIYPAMEVHSLWIFLGAGVILALVNLLIRPFLLLLTLPLNFLTLGLFTLVINSWMVMLTAFFLPGLVMPGFWAALVTAVIISVMNWLVKGTDLK